MINAISAWCRKHLGSAAAATLFTTGNLARVFGLRLVDGREVVVKIRPAEARQAGCTAVQRHLYQTGFPCPEPLAGPAPLNGTAFAGATVEQSRDFLDAYQRARGRWFSSDEIQQTWAAGLWIRSFNAKKFLLDGFDTLTPAEAEERLRSAAAAAR